MKVMQKVQQYLTNLPSFLPNSRGVAANSAAIIEFGAHVVVIGSLFMISIVA